MKSDYRLTKPRHTKKMALEILGVVPDLDFKPADFKQHRPSEAWEPKGSPLFLLQRFAISGTVTTDFGRRFDTFRVWALAKQDFDQLRQKPSVMFTGEGWNLPQSELDEIDSLARAVYCGDWTHYHFVEYNDIVIVFPLNRHDFLARLWPLGVSRYGD